MVVTVTTPGGRIGDDSVVVYGMPSFAVGEDVLLYLQQAPDGDVRPTALALGAYRVTIAVDGSLACRWRPPARRAALDEVVATVQAMNDPGSGVASAQDTAATPTSARFTMLGLAARPLVPARQRQPVRLALANSMRSSARQRATRSSMPRSAPGRTCPRPASCSSAPARGRRPVDREGVVRRPERHPVQRPRERDPALVQCSGVLAVGGFCSKGGMTTVNGDHVPEDQRGRPRRWRTASATASSAQGYEEIVTHEVGHVIGLGHSSRTRTSRSESRERDDVLPGAPRRARRDPHGRRHRRRLVHLSRRDRSERPRRRRRPNDDDDCPSTPAGRAVDATGCSCQDTGARAVRRRAPLHGRPLQCATGGCSTTPIDCTDGDPCLTGTCSEENGCATAPVAGNAAVLCVYQRPYRRRRVSASACPSRCGRCCARRRASSRAASANDPKFFEKADKKLARARKAIDQRAARKKKPQSPICATRARHARRRRARASAAHGRRHELTTARRA
jgi:hypothetical protein